MELIGVLLWQTLLMGLLDHRVRLSGREIYEGLSVKSSPRSLFTAAMQTQMSTSFPLSVIAQTCPVWCCLVPALRASSSETSESTGGVTSLITVQTAISCVPLKKTTTTTLCNLLQVWGRSPRELSDRHVGLAVAVGDCDWLLLLHLRSGTAEFDRSSPSSAGHRQRQHRACSAGQCPQELTFKLSFP